jgi:tight adherence protein B
MTFVMAVALGAALWLIILPGRTSAHRLQLTLPAADRRHGTRRAVSGLPGSSAAGVVSGRNARFGKRNRRQESSHMTVVVQQLAALLKGGRTPSRLWDELATLYPAGSSEFTSGRDPRPGRVPRASQAVPAGRAAPEGAGRTKADVSGAAFQLVLAAARAASLRGSPVSDAIRSATTSAYPGRSGNRRIWDELAACFDIAEASGCPLADILTRFAAQLEAEDDADAARQTALAGPKATVKLLTWLPFLGLALGTALGVDPLKILLGTPYGIAALVAGILLTLAGRAWSARLVQHAAGMP